MLPATLSGALAGFCKSGDLVIFPSSEGFSGDRKEVGVPVVEVDLVGEIDLARSATED